MKLKISLMAVGLLSAASLWADPPARVARLNFITGSVSFRPASLEDWAPATVNYPMTTGDHLWTDQDGRAELHIGSTTFRLGPQTALEILNLDDRTLQVKVAQGALSVHPRHVREDEVLEVDTPNSAVSIGREGVYRINVGEDGKTAVTVRHGEVELTAAGQAVPVQAAQEADVANGDPATYDVEDAGPEDGFDDWALDRDRHEEHLDSTRYVSDELVGVEDLDTYGHWREVGDYGPVWTPATVEVGWAPYRNGHWAWVAPWGWTWVDDAPWGFAPFHYGRWAYVQGGWGWYPGTIIERPVYAPALVAFVGGGGWSASLSFGGGFGAGAAAVGWFPLGPHEIYVPPYPVGVNYVRQVNITHVTNINVNNITVNNGVVTNVNVQRTYVNQSVNGAVTAVPQTAFVSARSVASVAAVVPPRVVATAAVSTGTPVGVQASAVSVLGHAPGSVASVPRPPAVVLSRTFVAKVAPPPPVAAFSPTLHPVVTNLPPKPASQAVGIQGLKPAVPLTGGVGLKPLRPNLVAPRVVSATEVHSLPAVQSNTTTGNSGFKPTNQNNSFKPGGTNTLTNTNTNTNTTKPGSQQLDSFHGTTGASPKPGATGSTTGTTGTSGGQNFRPPVHGTPAPTGVQTPPPGKETFKPTGTTNNNFHPAPSPTPKNEEVESFKGHTNTGSSNFRPTGNPTPAPSPKGGTNNEEFKSSTHGNSNPEVVKPTPTPHPHNESTPPPHHNEPTPPPHHNESKPTPKPSPKDH
jgi:hypothetical protein